MLSVLAIASHDAHINSCMTKETRQGPLTTSALTGSQVTAAM